MVLDQYQALVDLKVKTIDGVVFGDQRDQDPAQFTALVSNLEDELELEPSDDDAPRDLAKLAAWLHARTEA